MRWPWHREPEPEVRSEPEPEGRSTGFSSAVTEALISLAAGDGATGKAAQTAALETCAGLWARAFASARIKPESAVTEAVTPAVLALIGRDLIRRGESVHEIRIIRGRVRIIPVGSWDVRGSWDAERWVYRLDLFGPSGNITRLRPASSVLHCRYAVDPARPYIGIGPLSFATLTGDLSGALELRLSQEAGGKVAHILPIPTDGGDDSVNTLKADIGNAKGGTLLAETTAAGWGDGRSAAPQADWKPRRMGADPPEVLDALRANVALGVAAACGVPPVLVAGRVDGTAMREAWRQFLFGSVLPVARTVEAELAEKLDTPVSLDFTELHASDLAGRARAFQSMVGAGMDVAEAASIAGLMAR